MVYCRIFDNRARGSQQLLAGYRGTVVADGYGAYEALPRAGPGFTLAHCWAHARGKFVEIEPHYPWQVREILDLIREFYAVERDVLTQEDSQAARLALRGLGEAIRYLQELWSGLTRFLDDPVIPLDNNPVERALRGLVVGRKNHYG